MKSVSIAICLIVLHGFASDRIFAHGVEGIVDKGGLAVTAVYDTGEPMSYAKVDISAPNAELPFQSGRTDRNGRFCFFPDTKGEWKMTINDEMGHQLEMVIPVDQNINPALPEKNQSTGEKRFHRYEKAIMGVSILFGLFGVFSWIQMNRRRSPGNHVSN